MDEGAVREVGDVVITGYAVPSVQFDRRISENGLIGRIAWSAIQWLETHHSDRAARLGCYVQIVVTKQS
jgi:hypothetical protein